MTTRRSFAPLVAPALALSLVMAGCGSDDALVEQAPTTGPPGASAPDDDAAEIGLSEDVTELNEDEIETIRQLPEDQVDLALAQKICPVSDEPLGSMGVPIAMDVKDTTVFICCAGCKGEVEENPDAILTKLGKD